MIRLISTERGALGTIRRFQHATYGIVVIVTVDGIDGSADIVNITAVTQAARALKGAASAPCRGRGRGRKPAA